jgi:predicted alpha/beta-fold hydrolase
MNSNYIAPKWLLGGNAQTIYPYFLNPSPHVAFRRERWELDDGDFVDIDWLEGALNKPLVVMFHGLEGNSRSHYALSMMNQLREQNWRGAVIHFRGCSGQPNRLPRAYHAGDSMEIDWMLRRVLHQCESQKSGMPFYVIGISLGGNVLLKWLGEQGGQINKLITAAVAVSAPLDLAAAGKALDSGFNQFYTRHFLSSLKRKALEKHKRFPGLLDAKAVAASATLYEFDNHVTAPLHGFRDADEYWSKSSSKPWLQHIQVPTLVINARNDPFMPAHVLPTQEKVSPMVILEFPEQGGHVGFMQGIFPGQLRWLPQRIIEFFKRYEYL